MAATRLNWWMRPLGPALTTWRSCIKSQDQLLVLGATLLVIVPFLVLAGNLVAQAGDSVQLSGDLALIELATREATVGHRLTGPWGRFGWSHPGPALFYALAPAYRALGGSPLGLYAGAVAVGAISTVAAVRLGGRLLGGSGALAAATTVLGLAVSGGPSFLGHVWNPYVVTLPTLLCALLCISVAVRDGRRLPAAVAVGSFAVQTHVGTTPFVATALLASLLLRYRPRSASKARLLGEGTWRSVQCAALGWGIVALLWTPVLVEQLTASDDGNVSELAQFFLTQRAAQFLGSAVRAFAFGATAMPLGAPTVGVLPSRLSMVCIAVLFSCVLASLVCLRGGRARLPAVQALGVLTIAGSGVCIVALSRVVGPLYGYLVHWMVVVPGLAWLGLATLVYRCVLAPGPTTVVESHRSHRLVAALAAPTILAVIAGVGALDGHIGAADHDPDVAALVTLLQPVIGQEARSILINVANYGHGEWKLVAGIVAELESRGLRVAVTDPWLERYGNAYRSTRPVEREVIVGRVGVQPLPPRISGAALVGRTQAAVLWVK
jgi:hypothetical protein